MSEQAQVVTIDGTEYKSNELSQEQIRLFNKVSKWQQQVISLRDSLEDAQDLYNTNYNKLKKQLDRITVSQNVYTNNLIQLLKDKEVTDDKSQ